MGIFIEMIGHIIRAYKAYHDAARVTSAAEGSGVNLAKARFQLAKFCDAQLRHLEMKEQTEGVLDVSFYVLSNPSFC